MKTHFAHNMIHYDIMILYIILIHIHITLCTLYTLYTLYTAFSITYYYCIFYVLYKTRKYFFSHTHICIFIFSRTFITLFLE